MDDRFRAGAVGGYALLRAMFDSTDDQYDRDQNNLGFNVGGGVMYSLNGRVGLRGDLRYFRAFVDEDKREGGYFKDYGFLRATLGITFGFPR
jgi:opacity protein-like surface antigen